MIQEIHIREVNDNSTHSDYVVTTNAFFGRSDRVQGCEAILLDTGAKGNLVGDRWIGRMDTINQGTGLPKSKFVKMPKPITLGGVGKGTQDAHFEAHVPCTISGEDVKFKATVLDNSDIPAILGMKSMQEMNGILDLRTNRLIAPLHHDDVTITAKDSTRVYQLQQAPGGYLMLPCTPGTTTLCKPKDYKYT